jgi:acyl-CoA synthetase (AMP-forming)/AMP-acid ligase II
LKRNVAGELHIGGTAVITGYLDGADPEAFYTDEYGSWLRTGDQATIDENGVVSIHGRYKDLIIRGGKNISPAKIEQCLGQIPGLFVSDSNSLSITINSISVGAGCWAPRFHRRRGSGGCCRCIFFLPFSKCISRFEL